MSRIREWFDQRFREKTLEERDRDDWLERVADHRDVCLCPFSGRMMEGGLVGRCEPHLGTLRDCRWHAHMFNRPQPGDYEQGPG